MSLSEKAKYDDWCSKQRENAISFINSNKEQLEILSKVLQSEVEAKKMAADEAVRQNEIQMKIAEEERKRKEEEERRIKEEEERKRKEEEEEKLKEKQLYDEIKQIVEEHHDEEPNKTEDNDDEEEGEENKPKEEELKPVEEKPSKQQPKEEAKPVEEETKPVEVEVKPTCVKLYCKGYSHLHYWKEGFSTTWPGVQFIDTTEDDWTFVSIADQQPPIQIIFNNNGGSQTETLNINELGDYWYDGSNLVRNKP